MRITIHIIVVLVLYLFGCSQQPLIDKLFEGKCVIDESKIEQCRIL